MTGNVLQSEPIFWVKASFRPLIVSETGGSIQLAFGGQKPEELPYIQLMGSYHNSGLVPAPGIPAAIVCVILEANALYRALLSNPAFGSVRFPGPAS